MRSAVRRIGNSAGVLLPRPVLADLGVAEGGAVEVISEPGKVTIVPADDPRAGWEEDSKRLAEFGLTEEDREWLDAKLTDDDDEDEWVWE